MTGVLLFCVLVLVLMVVGAGVLLEAGDVAVLAVDDAGVVELRVEVEMGLELVFDEAVDVAGVELELELELQPIDPQSCGVKLYPKLHSMA